MLVAYSVRNIKFSNSPNCGKDGALHPCKATTCSYYSETMRVSTRRCSNHPWNAGMRELTELAELLCTSSFFTNSGKLLSRFLCSDLLEPNLRRQNHRQINAFCSSKVFSFQPRTLARRRSTGLKVGISSCHSLQTQKLPCLQDKPKLLKLHLLQKLHSNSNRVLFPGVIFLTTSRDGAVQNAKAFRNKAPIDMDQEMRTGRLLHASHGQIRCELVPSNLSSATKKITMQNMQDWKACKSYNMSPNFEWLHWGLRGWYLGLGSLE